MVLHPCGMPITKAMPSSSSISPEPDCPPTPLDRDRTEAEAKYREQLETAMLRYDEVDSENRKLRSLKYELDSRVRR